MQVLGGVVLGVCGIVSVVQALFVLHSALGIWATVVGAVLAPMIFIASVIIVWVSTGHFPLLLLAIYLGAWLGLALLMLGGLWDGDDNDF